MPGAVNEIHRVVYGLTWSEFHHSTAYPYSVEQLPQTHFCPNRR